MDRERLVSRLSDESETSWLVVNVSDVDDIENGNSWGVVYVLREVYIFSILSENYVLPQHC